MGIARRSKPDLKTLPPPWVCRRHGRTFRTRGVSASRNGCAKARGRPRSGFAAAACRTGPRAHGALLYPRTENSRGAEGDPLAPQRFPARRWTPPSPSPGLTSPACRAGSSTSCRRSRSRTGTSPSRTDCSAPSRSSTASSPPSATSEPNSSAPSWTPRRHLSSSCCRIRTGLPIHALNPLRGGLLFPAEFCAPAKG